MFGLLSLFFPIRLPGDWIGVQLLGSWDAMMILKRTSLVSWIIREGRTSEEKRKNGHYAITRADPRQDEYSRGICQALQASDLLHVGRRLPIRWPQTSTAVIRNNLEDNQLWPVVYFDHFPCRHPLLLIDDFESRYDGTWTWLQNQSYRSVELSNVVLAQSVLPQVT